MSFFSLKQILNSASGLGEGILSRVQRDRVHGFLEEEDVRFSSRNVCLEVAKNFLIPGLQFGFLRLELLAKNELGISFNREVPNSCHHVFEGGVIYPHLLKLEGNVSNSYRRASR